VLESLVCVTTNMHTTSTQVAEPTLADVGEESGRQARTWSLFLIFSSRIVVWCTLGRVCLRRSGHVCHDLGRGGLLAGHGTCVVREGVDHLHLLVAIRDLYR